VKNSFHFNSLFVIGWSAIQEKHSYQLNHFRSACVSFKVFVTTQTDYFQAQKNSFPNEFFLLHKNFVLRLLQVCSFFNSSERPTAIFLAPAGRFAVAYALLAKLYRMKIVAIEWGDLYEIHERDFITRFFYLRIMRRADVVWFKEPYMKELLLKNNCSKVFYIPNSVPLNSNWQAGNETKEFDFIWANRNITTRYPELFIKSLIDLSSDRRVTCLFIGLFKSEKEIDDWLFDIGYVRLDLERVGITFKPFGEIKDWILKSRFFVLLADHVFGNNSLLESMSAGLVPLVNRVDGIQGTVIPHISGFLTELNNEDLKANILEMLNLKDEEYQALSLKGRTLIETDFGIEKWQSEVDFMLKGLRNGA